MKKTIQIPSAQRLGDNLLRHRLRQCAAAAVVAASLIATDLGFTQDQLPGTRLAEELSQAFERVAETITPSVVTISTESSPKKTKAKQGEDPLRKFFGDDFFDKMAPTPQRGREPA